MPRVATPNPLDALILKAIEEDRNVFYSILMYCRHKRPHTQFRDVDRRLQALRRKGLIHYTGHLTSKGWRLGAKENS
jgi:hypothetical protein